MMQKLVFKSLLLILFVSSVINLWSQRSTDILKLNEISAELQQEWIENQQKVEEYAAKNNMPVRQELADGRVIQMVNIIDGIPEYYTTFNYGAAQTTRVVELWEGGSSDLNLSGDGYDQLGEWDAGISENRIRNLLIREHLVLPIWMVKLRHITTQPMLPAPSLRLE